MFSNKKILVICKETYSYPFFHLCQKWIKDNEVAAYFFNPVETRLNKCLLNDTTYFAFKEKLSVVKMYDSNEIADEYTEVLYSESIIDEDYLHQVEREYTHYKNLNAQILSTQFLTRHYHYRNYNHRCTYVQQLNWLILNYKNAERILDDFKPDMVLDCDLAELARVVMSEICFKRNIPYITTDPTRFEEYLMGSYNLDYIPNHVFLQRFEENTKKTDAELKDSLDYVEKFRGLDSIMQKIYKGDVTSQYKPDPILRQFVNWIFVIRYFINQDFVSKNHFLKKSNPILYPNCWEFIFFFLRHKVRKQYLLRKNKYFSAPMEGVKYVYMPLHLIPESSTFSMAPNYINELTVIEAVSKNLPAGWWLYVKEHQAMVGERGTDFYDKVNKFPNVKMVQLNYYIDPKPWIMKSQGVVTISGTSAFEAALLGKHAIIFSDVPFSLIDGIKREKSFENLYNDFLEFGNTLNNEKSCAEYISTVKELGQSVNLKHIMKQTELWFRGCEELDDKLMENVENLEKIFLDYYEMFSQELQLRKEHE